MGLGKKLLERFAYVLVTLASIFGFKTAYAHWFAAEETPNCSAQETREAVGDVARDQLKKMALSIYNIDVDKTTIEEVAIRTQSKTDTAYECAASLRYHLTSSGTPSDGDKVPNADQLKPVAEYLNTDVTYKVQLTDDKKTIYVEVLGLKGTEGSD